MSTGTPTKSKTPPPPAGAELLRQGPALLGVQAMLQTFKEDLVSHMDEKYEPRAGLSLDQKMAGAAKAAKAGKAGGSTAKGAVTARKKKPKTLDEILGQQQ